MNTQAKNIITAIFEKDKKIKENKQAKEQELADAKAALEKACADADAAVEAENKDAFRKADNKKREIEQDAEFLEKTIKKLASGVAAEDVADAWHGYAELYNADFDKKWAAYEKNRKALAKQLLEIIEMQNEAFSVRDDLGELGNCRNTLEEVHCIPARDGGLPLVGGTPKITAPVLGLCQDSALIIREVVGMNTKMPEDYLDLFNYLYQIIVNHLHLDADITL